MKKRREKVNIANRSLIKLAVLFYGKGYFSKKVVLTVDGNFPEKNTPYIIAANHASFADVGGIAVALLPEAASYIASRTQYSRFGGLLNLAGVMPKKQFTVDTSLVRDIKYVLSKRRPVVLYPEAKLSVDGTQNIIKPAAAKLVKLMKVPLYTVRFDGSYLHHPRWAKSNRKVPLKATVRETVSADEAKSLSAEEILIRMTNALSYDDYAYQAENRIEIKVQDLVEGLESILFRCPACGGEFTMRSHGDKLFCERCGQAVSMNEFGEFSGGRFHNVKEWYAWERKCVADEISAGIYGAEAVCEAEEQVKYKFKSVGKATLRHDGQGNISVKLQHGELFYPAGTFYTTSSDARYLYLPCKDTVYRLRFGDGYGLSAKINLAVEEFAAR